MKWLRWRVPLGFVVGISYLMLARSSSLVMLKAASVVVLLGCALRGWAAGYLLKGKRLAVGGPYAYVRNPLYLGSFVIGAGFCLALWQDPLPFWTLGLWMAFLLGFFALYASKSKAEEGELVSSLGEAYRRYAARVPAILPVYGRVRDLGRQRFSVELYRRNREYQCLLGSLIFLIVLYLRHYTRL